MTDEKPVITRGVLESVKDDALYCTICASYTSHIYVLTCGHRMCYLCIENMTNGVESNRKYRVLYKNSPSQTGGASERALLCRLYINDSFHTCPFCRCLICTPPCVDQMMKSLCSEHASQNARASTGTGKDDKTPDEKIEERVVKCRASLELISRTMNETEGSPNLMKVMPRVQIENFFKGLDGVFPLMRKEYCAIWGLTPQAIESAKAPQVSIAMANLGIRDPLNYEHAANDEHIDLINAKSMLLLFLRDMFKIIFKTNKTIYRSITRVSTE